MNTEKFTRLLRGVATIAGSVAFADKGLVVAAVLQTVAKAVEAGERGIDQLEEVARKVDELVSADREPTAIELKRLRKRSDEIHAELAALKNVDVEPPVSS